MSIADDVNQQLKEAMKARDPDRLKALRNVRAAFIAAMKEDGRDTLGDEEALAILRKLAKVRQESIASYEAGGREDLVAEERTELGYLEAFLPQLADEATTARWVDEAIAATGATSIKELGKVMGKLMAEHKADVDGKLAQRILKDKLGA